MGMPSVLTMPVELRNNPVLAEGNVGMLWDQPTLESRLFGANPLVENSEPVSLLDRVIGQNDLGPLEDTEGVGLEEMPTRMQMPFTTPLFGLQRQTQNVAVRFKNMENGVETTIDLTEEECDRLLESRKVVDIGLALLTPVRTNNLKNFVKDFFLPATIHKAAKVKNTVMRLFAVLGALVLDSMTFPIRLLTCLPRVIDNIKHKESPLFKYLKSRVDPKLLESDYVGMYMGNNPVENIAFIEIPRDAFAHLAKS